jgi:hypothetical protein
LSIESPTKKSRQEDGNSFDSSPSASARGAASLQSILQPNLSIEESYSGADTLPPSTPQQQKHRTTIVPQTSSFSSTEIMATTSEYKKNIVIWKHFTKATLDSKREGYLHHSEESLIWNNTTATGGGGKGNNSSGNNSINEELNMSYKFPRMYLQNPSELDAEFLKREAWWYKLQSGVESTLGHVRSESIKQKLLLQGGEGKQQHQQQNHRGSDAASISSKSTNLFFSKSPIPTSNKTINDSNNNNGEFSPSAQPTNVWSEPSASTMKVRGPTYAQDGVKIASEESMFAILGVDNFVKDKEGGSGNNNCKSGTSSFRERWKSVCMDVGVETVPFL